ncbi:hypothetical protein [Streptomyces sp. NPDC056169]|uniref:hypothetical protein n=1 Tax=Streptomyces sp. NPDC056169 TaxID=3345734 RepID=UPI0035E228AF
MPAPTQHDEARAVYHRCRLGKSELNRLFSLAPEGISSAAVTISTQRNSTRYTANTLTDLVDHVRNSNVRRANRAVLQPTVDIPQGSWWSRASSGDKIALGALGVGFLSLLVALATLEKDLIEPLSS